MCLNKLRLGSNSRIYEWLNDAIRIYDDDDDDRRGEENVEEDINPIRQLIAITSK